jgi:hypothetical protein
LEEDAGGYFIVGKIEYFDRPVDNLFGFKKNTARKPIFLKE